MLGGQAVRNPRTVEDRTQVRMDRRDGMIRSRCSVSVPQGDSCGTLILTKLLILLVGVAGVEPVTR
jgi:hypothetical protein